MCPGGGGRWAGPGLPMRWGEAPKPKPVEGKDGFCSLLLLGEGELAK